MWHINSFNIFAEEKIGDLFSQIVQNIRSDVNGKPDNYILNVNETEFINYLLNKYIVENLEFKFDDIFVTTSEEQIPAEDFPPIFLVYQGKSYPKDVITYHIPFTGDERLLTCTPKNQFTWSPNVYKEENCICIEIINFSDNPETIKREADSQINNIKMHSENIRTDVKDFNSTLENQIKKIFLERKQHLLQKYDLVTSLGVPFKRREDIPGTFAIPTPIRKKILPSPPAVSETGYKPEPTLGSDVYQEIIQTIHAVGKQFERLPSLYRDKREEDLRDHFLLCLESGFEGSATGETFNKNGKTDILLRYNGVNIFIAECKFWKGEKAFLDTITQLLGYLSWRDSKAAVIIFVQNKAFSSVLDTVEKVTPNHPNYLGYTEKKDESRFSYRFHINADPNREVKLTVLLFHIPSE